MTLTLADLTDMVVERTTHGPMQMVVRMQQPFAAIFRKAKNPTPARYAELIVMSTLYDLGPPDKRYLKLLREQFPSLHQRYRKETQKGKHWWMNDRDYALMRVFFGGLAEADV